MSAPATPQPLDRPVWSALTSGWVHLAQGEGAALRLDPDYGPFGATADDSGDAKAALARLVGPGEEVFVIEREAVKLPGLRVLRNATLVQMVAETIAPVAEEPAIVALGDDDAVEMRALAALTEPGPFAARTHEFGFVGIRRDCRLAAMAGERMRLTGYAEVSGVCTHPDERGRGLAATLMSTVMRRIVARGETPFLHSFAGNAGAIALYERLGFRQRRELTVSFLTRDPAASP